VKPDNIGALVREWRERSGLSVTAFARRAKVSYQSIQQLEKGEVEQPRYVDKLAKAMGCSIDDIHALRAPPPLGDGLDKAGHDVDLAPEPAPAAAAYSSTLSREAVILGLMFDGLPAIFDDGSSKREFFVWLQGKIQGRPHVRLAAEAPPPEVAIAKAAASTRSAVKRAGSTAPEPPATAPRPRRHGAR
jgi:transcriptional regulator with XRE-family HTH domain